MKLSKRIELVSILKELARTREPDVSGSRLEELLPGGNIRKIYMKGDVMTIYLSETISVKRVKNRERNLIYFGFSGNVSIAGD